MCWTVDLDHRGISSLVTDIPLSIVAFRRCFGYGAQKKWGGGVLTVALKNENLRGISEQHRFTFELYDKNSFEVNFQSEGNHKV